MAAIEISGLDEVKAMLLALGGELEKVNENSQNAMAYDIWGGEKAQMVADLDRPVPFSLNAVLYKRYGVTDALAPPVQGAAVYMKDAFHAGSRVGPDEYLGVQTLGGSTAGPRRSEKTLQRFGFIPTNKVWVPAQETPLDAYGNVSGALISAMLTALGTNPYAPPLSLNYAMIGPVGNAVGVIRKVSGNWVPFIWFVDRQSYSERFDWYGRAEREVALSFNTYLNRYLQIGLQRL